MLTHILLADDHKIFSDSLSLLLSGLNGVEIVGQVSNGKQVLTFLEQFPVDLVLSDLHMPYMNGIEMILHIRRRFPKVRVLVLTMAEDAAHIREALQAGAAGYILKSAGRDELEKALAAIAAGQQYISSNVFRNYTAKPLLQMKLLTY
ncbi:MAG: response regulator transcription factor [Rudanella sp.]|nr:response regulator transcription factor [Rudanella sp.]